MNPTKHLKYVSLGVISLFLIQNSPAQTEERGEETLPPVIEKKKIVKKKGPRSILFPSHQSPLHIPSSPKIDGNSSSVLLDEEALLEKETARQIREENQITVADLTHENPAVGGTLNYRNGGFTENMWVASRLDKISFELNHIKINKNSPFLNDIYRRLLLTSAKLPLSNLDNSYVSKNFLSLRLQKIKDAGSLKDYSDFMGLIPSEYFKETPQNIEKFITADQQAKACELMQRSLDDDESQLSEYLEKIDLFCRAIEGDVSAVEISMDMMAEDGRADEEYFTLINRYMTRQDTSEIDEISETQKTVQNLKLGERLDALTLYLYLKSGVILSDQFYKVADHFALQKIVLNNFQNQDLRKDALNRLRQDTHYPFNLTAQQLTEIYGSFSYSTELKEEIYEIDAPTDAQIFQIISNTLNDSERVNLLNLKWQALEKDKLQTIEVGQNSLAQAEFIGAFSKFAALNAQSIKQLTPAIEIMPYSENIIQSLLLNKDWKQATAWFYFLKIEAINGSDNAEEIMIKLWPLLVILDSDGDIPWSNDTLKNWWTYIQGPEQNEKAAYFFGLATALNYSVPSEMIKKAAAGYAAEMRNSPSSSQTVNLAEGDWRELALLGRSPAKQQKLGEVLLVTLKSVQDIPLDQLDILGMTSIIRALRHVGLEKEAREFAFEALILKGY